MVRSATRLSPRLLEELERLARSDATIADIWRALRVAAAAAGNALPPSYERVRVLVHELRALDGRDRPTAAEVYLDVAFGKRPAEALLDHVTGTLD